MVLLVKWLERLFRVQLVAPEDDEQALLPDEAVDEMSPQIEAV